MKRLLSVSLVLACVVTGTASAQLQPVYSRNRMEIAPVFGYMWGGSADFASQGGQPGGSINWASSFLWGVDLAFRASRGSWLELYYRRQDTEIHGNQNFGVGDSVVKAATNIIHIGGRQDFQNHTRVIPYIRGSLGLTVFDNKTAGKGTHTDFSLGIGGGFTYMMPNNRIGIRANLNGWFSFVPSNQVGIYCSPYFPYYCYAATTSQTVSQGEVSGALVFRF
ncbi:MAG TPA: hypothetical protein VJN95_00810 [Gemmatimonadales bacterium]|nr:hypothetical protein [Gemmatimonadales bacterium]